MGITLAYSLVICAFRVCFKTLEGDRELPKLSRQFLVTNSPSKQFLLTALTHHSQITQQL
jgi:hypothetical protein